MPVLDVMAVVFKGDSVLLEELYHLRDQGKLDPSAVVRETCAPIRSPNGRNQVDREQGG